MSECLLSLEPLADDLFLVELAEGQRNHDFALVEQALVLAVHEALQVSEALHAPLGQVALLVETAQLLLIELLLQVVLGGVLELLELVT